MMSEGMSEGTAVAEQEDDKAATKRKTLSLGERIKVVDYLRSLVEPIVADSNAAVAAVVSDATKVDINWQQLKYMIDDPTLADMKLGSKVYVKSAVTGEDDRMSVMEKRLAELAAYVYTMLDVKIEDISVTMSDRLDALEAKQ